MLRVLVIILLFTVNAQANDNYHGMPKIGSSTLSWLFWDAYDITLYAEHGRYDPENSYAFALKLEYKMDFTGKEIAERSVKEIRGQGSASEEQLKKWSKLMLEIFPDVKKGDHLVGSVSDDGLTFFKHNGEEVASFRDEDFNKAFFGIWLSENTSEPDLRKELLARE